jgi:aspartyl protease family protein
MGVFHVTIEAADRNGTRFEPVDVLVDTGATYTTLPAEMLRRFGVQPIRRQRFLLADGSEMTKEVGEARVRVEGREQNTVVVFADNGATSLLGAVTLEELGLAVDPVGRQLIEVRGYMM